MALKSMETLLTDAPTRKRWTREECDTLEFQRLFEQERLELIEGDLISRRGKKRPHINSVTLMIVWLADAFGPRFVNFAAQIDVSPGDSPTN